MNGTLINKMLDFKPVFEEQKPSLRKSVAQFQAEFSKNFWAQEEYPPLYYKSRRIYLEPVEGCALVDVASLKINILNYDRKIQVSPPDQIIFEQFGVKPKSRAVGNYMMLSRDLPASVLKAVRDDEESPREIISLGGSGDE